MMINQNPEQIARDNIDRQLLAAGWIIQAKSKINLNAGQGVAVREYQTSVGPADYVLFVDKQAVGIIEAKREENKLWLNVEANTSLYNRRKHTKTKRSHLSLYWVNLRYLAGLSPDNSIFNSY